MFRYLLIIIAFSGCVLCKKVKQEGSKCRWHGDRGTCVSKYKCMSAFEVVSNGTEAPVCLVKDDIPIICCTDCWPRTDVWKIIWNKELGFLDLKGQKAFDQCVHYVDELKYPCKGQFTTEIFRTYYPLTKCYQIGSSLNGYITHSPTLPPRKETYLAILGYGAVLKDAKWSCAGAIISPKFILTAAHCFSNALLMQYVAVGIERRTDPLELWKIYEVERTIPHPDYKPPSKYHDIGLVETKEMITFSEAVLPACLHTGDSPQETADTIALHPRGEGKYRRQTFTLTYIRPAKLEQFDELQCTFFYPNQESLPNGFDNKTQFCFGTKDEPEEDSCLSDSGAPLLSTWQEYLCAPLIIGVTSLDRTCGSSGSSGLYTRVSYYIPWIESIVWP